MRPSRRMLDSSWFNSSKVSGGILPWKPGSIFSAFGFIITPPFLHAGGFRAGALHVIVKPKAGLAVGARLLNGLSGVCTADTDATGIAERIQAAGAEGGQGRFVGLARKVTAHNHYLRIVIVNVRYGKSPLP